MSRSDDYGREIPTVEELMIMIPFPKVLHRAVSDEGMGDFMVLVGDTQIAMLEKKARELIPASRYLAISHSYVYPEFRCESI
jgi:hypothetical protein